MGTEIIVSFDVLQEELDKAKSNLRGLNDNIRRISGREPSEQLRGDRKRPLDRRLDRSNNDFHSPDNRNRMNRGDSPPIIKRKIETKSVFSRLSGPPNRDDDLKPKLNSRIIRELPTKEEIVEAQGSDPASRARNRRMFGSLLGTLQKFCQEESRLKQKEEKKAQIEKKLEEQQLQERLKMKRERQSLYSNRKRQQLEIKMLETKMNLMKEFSTWEESKKPLMHFIRTKTKPRIYFSPKVLDKRTEKKLEESKRDMEKQIEKRRAEVNKEMADIVKQFDADIEALKEPNDNTNINTNPTDRSSDKRDSSHTNATNEKNKDNSFDGNDESKNRRNSHHQRNNDNDHSADDDDDDDDDDDKSDSDEDERRNTMMSGVAIKVEKDDDHIVKNHSKDDNERNDEVDEKPKIHSPSKA